MAVIIKQRRARKNSPTPRIRLSRLHLNGKLGSRNEEELERYNRRPRLLLAGLLALALTVGGFTRACAQQSSMEQGRPTPTPEADAAPLMVTVHPFPSFGAAPLTVGFILSTALDEDDPIVSYKWNFGDGQIASKPPYVMFHTYKKPGSYVVTVSVTTATGRIGIGMGAVIASPRAR
jgi:PKD domain